MLGGLSRLGLVCQHKLQENRTTESFLKFLQDLSEIDERSDVGFKKQRRLGVGLDWSRYTALKLSCKSCELFCQGGLLHVS